MLIEIEALAGHPVHVRSGRGVALTAVGEALAARAARILRELDETAEDIAAVAAGRQGRVRVGAVTAPALDLLLPALRTLRLTHPGVSTDVTVAPSALLCQELKSGRLDLALGRLADPGDARLLDLAPMGTEPVALVTRRDHPLAGHGRIGAADLRRFDWVLPDLVSPLGAAVVAAFAAQGAAMPRQYLTTASFLLTLTLIRQTNAIAPLARAVAMAFAGGPDGPLVILDTVLAIDAGPFGLLTRRGETLSPAARELATRIRAARAA
jgi:DNA-binding transcriptional LysR family regulator